MSSFITTYLKPPGQERRDLQKQLAKLYDKRSTAAHGAIRKSKNGGDPDKDYDGEDLLATFMVLRDILLKIVSDRNMPDKEKLEEQLFGVESGDGCLKNRRNQMAQAACQNNNESLAITGLAMNSWAELAPRPS